MKKKGKNKYNKNKKYNKNYDKELKKLLTVFIGIIILLSLIPYFLMI
ncbi:hypothetical protein [Methanofervidicoccus abyssi]|nr:hypothetical protein [Methanofervidicoccus abyssi]